MKNFYILTLNILFFFICFSGAKDNYEDFDSSNKSLLIAPITIFYSEVESEVFKENDFIKSLVNNARLQTEFEAIDYFGDKHIPNLSKVMLNDGSKQFLMKLPKKKNQIKYNSKVVDFILFMDNIYIKTALHNNQGMTIELNYVLWDNSKARSIKYGTIQEKIAKNNDNATDQINEFTSIAIRKITQQKEIKYKNDKYHIFAVKFGPTYRYHMVDSDEDDPNIPNRYEQPQEHPSVNHFFNSGFSIVPAFEYRYHTNGKRISIGFEYNKETISKGLGNKALFTYEDNSPSKQALNIESIFYTISFGWLISIQSVSYGYIKGKIITKKYDLDIRFDNLIAEIDVWDYLALSFALGADYMIPDTNIELFGELGFEFSDARIKEPKFKLSDNQLIINLGASYLFHL